MAKKMKNFKSISLIILFTIFTAVFIFKNDGVKYDIGFLMICFIIAEFSIVKIFYWPVFPFSLDIIVHLFFLFFIGIAPALQFKKQIFFWEASHNLNTYDYILGSLLMLFVLLLYNVLYSIVLRYMFVSCRKSKSSKKNISKVEININILILISIVSFLVFFQSKGFNFLAVMFRGVSPELKGVSTVNDSSLSLIMNIFVRPIPLVSLLVFKLFSYKKFFSKKEFLLILITLFSNSPTGMPRFQAAALYIPLLLVYSGTLKKQLNFSLLFCFSLIIVFPFLNQFRRYDNSVSSLNIDTEMFVQEHFDTYQNTIKVIKSNDITYGNQLLGAVFFYVPRSIWKSKPFGSGQFIAEKYNYNFSNISMSFFGEGYVNFGYLGMFIFVLVLAVFCAKLDFKFWYVRDKNNFLKLYYLILLGMLFFTLRGDLLNATAYTCGLLLSAYSVYRLAIFKFTF